jgi:hypothetical protein
MPDLSSFHYIKNVIIITPDIFKFVCQPAVKNSKQRIAAGKPFAAIGIIPNMMVEVIQKE